MIASTRAVSGVSPFPSLLSPHSICLLPEGKREMEARAGEPPSERLAQAKTTSGEIAPVPIFAPEESRRARSGSWPLAQEATVPHPSARRPRRLLISNLKPPIPDGTGQAHSHPARP
jgi:hypothetical protein